MHLLNQSFLLLLLFGVFLQTGCDKLAEIGKQDQESKEKEENESKTDLLIGTWKASIYISPEEAAKMSEEPIPEGLSMEMTGTGTSSYHHGGKYTSEGEVTIRLKNKENDQELVLKFSFKDAGTFEVHGDTLVETAVDSKVTPLNDMTKQMLEEDPSMADAFSPVKGETTSYKIVELTKSIAELEMKDPKMRITLRKKD